MNKRMAIGMMMATLFGCQSPNTLPISANYSKKVNHFKYTKLFT